MVDSVQLQMAGQLHVTCETWHAANSDKGQTNSRLYQYIPHAYRSLPSHHRSRPSTVPFYYAHFPNPNASSALKIPSSTVKLGKRRLSGEAEASPSKKAMTVRDN